MENFFNNIDGYKFYENKTTSKNLIISSASLTSKILENYILKQEKTTYIFEIESIGNDIFLITKVKN